MKPGRSVNADNPSISRGALRVTVMMMMIIWASDLLSSRSAGVLASVPIIAEKQERSLSWGRNGSASAAYVTSESFLPATAKLVANDFAWPTAASLRNVGIYAQGQNANKGGVQSGQPSGEMEREVVWARADAAAAERAAEGVMPVEKEFSLFFSVMASEFGSRASSHDTMARVSYASNLRPLPKFPRYTEYSMDRISFGPF